MLAAAPACAADRAVVEMARAMVEDSSVAEGWVAVDWEEASEAETGVPPASLTLPQRLPLTAAGPLRP